MKTYDALIIGGGPGGYSAAARLARAGKTVALFERKKLGGSCLHVGCIPTKLLQSAASRYHALAREGGAWGIEFDNLRFNFGTLVDRSRKTIAILEKGIHSQMASAGVEVVQGEAVLREPGLVACGALEYAGKDVILATGSRPKHLRSFPLGEGVVTSDELLTQPRLPKSILIVGAGVIGLEFAALYAQLGVRVRVGDVLPRIVPTMDVELAQALLNSLRKLGVEMELGATEVRPKDEELVLLAVGRAPNLDQSGLPSIGLEVVNGRIATDGYLRTSRPGLYALGDLTAKFPYAHTAYEHARVAAGRILNGPTGDMMDDLKVPHVIFTTPEIASVGMTEEEAKRSYPNAKTRRNNFAANSKARILSDVQGWGKLVYDGDSGRILGAHLVGPEATDLIGEACVLVAREVTMDQLEKVVHPHPTLSEIFQVH